MIIMCSKTKSRLLRSDFTVAQAGLYTPHESLLFYHQSAIQFDLHRDACVASQFVRFGEEDSLADDEIEFDLASDENNTVCLDSQSGDLQFSRVGDHLLILKPSGLMTLHHYYKRATAPWIMCENAVFTHDDLQFLTQKFSSLSSIVDRLAYDCLTDYSVPTGVTQEEMFQTLEAQFLNREPVSPLNFRTF
ncbi:MAG: hypothetical protein DHS20C10_11290 [marine bacterium B5-7]|nr:MAG: hypothetical protein DHS20C10_11290 [marine bacterium B5-7]